MIYSQSPGLVCSSYLGVLRDDPTNEIVSTGGNRILYSDGKDMALLYVVCWSQRTSSSSEV